MTGGLGRFGRAAAADLGIDIDHLGVAPIDTAGIPWTSAFPVAELATDSVALASALMNRVSEARSGRRASPVQVDAMRVSASFGSERVLRVDGVAPQVWAPLSGFWATADGWVRTHANYPHHAGRLRALLGVGDDAGHDEVASAIAGWSRFRLEDAAVEVGAIVAAVRGAEEWGRHPQYESVADAPLVVSRRTGEAAPRAWHGSGGLPLAGVRVLDLTRVIAGPVAARDLAIAGADVLRIDDPRLPEIGWQHLDTGQQKHSALLNLADPSDREVLEGLLESTDVVVTGYRPGALDSFGIDPHALAATHPGLTIATVSAWGEAGPWSRRRGFDSIVQATVGIALAEQAAREAGAPAALPVQALDHASGHLLAAAVAAALVRQRREGGTHHVSVALARTGYALMRHRGSGWTAPGDTEPLPAVTVEVGDGSALTCAPPVLAFDGAPADYAWVHPWGSDEPRWQGAA